MQNSPILDPSDYFERKLVAVRLLAYMVWPDDEDRRVAAEATFAANLAIAGARLIRENEPTIRRHAAKHKRRVAPDIRKLFQRLLDDIDPSDWFQQHILKTYVEPLGGLGAITDSPSTDEIEREIGARLFDIYSTGNIILVIASMDTHHRREIRGGASVNKAVHVLCEVANLGLNDALKSIRCPTINQTSLKAAWRTFKPSAHLCGAYVFTEGEFGRGVHHLPAFYEEKTFWIFGSIAKRLEQFATSFVPKHGRNEPLIAASDMHLLPDDVFDSENVSFTPLPAEFQAALETYRAPIPS